MNKWDERFMQMAETVLPMSQLTVVVDPTAAVAAVPSEPTIAVSMYCTAVPRSCSNIVGHAKAKIMGTVCHGNQSLKRFIKAPPSSFDPTILYNESFKMSIKKEDVPIFARL